MKLCPIRQIKVKQQVHEERTIFNECIGELCAWYVEETDECALKCIATRLENGMVKVLCKTSDQ
jgi:hypothetical protein